MGSTLHTPLANKFINQRWVQYVCKEPNKGAVKLLNKVFAEPKKIDVSCRVINVSNGLAETLPFGLGM